MLFPYFFTARSNISLITVKETFSAILEWGLANFLELLEYHGGAEAVGAKK